MQRQLQAALTKVPAASQQSSPGSTRVALQNRISASMALG